MSPYLKMIFRITVILFIVILITSCSKKYIQLFTTSSDNTVMRDDYWVFENDTVKITYQFWAERGIMSFEFFNKLDKPIYIDWKNSSYIFNDMKMNYWTDEVVTQTTGSFVGFTYTGPLIKPDYALHYGTQESSSVASKPERITFIPPKSKFYKSSFFVVPYLKFSMDSSKASVSIEARRDNPKKKTTVYQEVFEKNNSPIVFRNFIAITFSEISQEYKFIDNEFFVSNVVQEDIRHFFGKTIGTGSDGLYIYEKMEKKPTKFYLITLAPTKLPFPLNVIASRIL